jgi:cytochrome c oxidase subunit 4
MTAWRPPLALVSAWLALLTLLALTVVLAQIPLGSLNAIVALTIAFVKAAVVATFFMELRHRGMRTFIFAGAGLFWLGILLWLGLMDYLTRT